MHSLFALFLTGLDLGIGAYEGSSRQVCHLRGGDSSVPKVSGD